MLSTLDSSILAQPHTHATQNGTTPEQKSRKKLVKLEAIRGFAALYVVLSHTMPRAIVIAGKEFYVFRHAHEAVILFFLLSGFVIQYAYSTSADKSFRLFFAKRFLRIFIPLACVFALNYLMVCLKQHGLASLDWGNLAGNFLMLQQVDELWRQPMLVRPFLENLPLWSLSFEWWFYMIFFFAVNKLGSKVSTIVFATGVLAGLMYIFAPLFVVRILMYLVIWWSGAEMARLYLSNQPITFKKMLMPLAALATVAGFLIINYFRYIAANPEKEIMLAFHPLVELRHFTFSIIAIVSAIVWQKLKWVGFKYTFGLFMPFASISFALYISHWFMVSQATYLDGIVSDFYIRVLIYFIICCAFCYLVEHIIYPKLNKKILRYLSAKWHTAPVQIDKKNINKW